MNEKCEPLDKILFSHHGCLYEVPLHPLEVRVTQLIAMHPSAFQFSAALHK